jgi:hypothetical protein
MLITKILTLKDVQFQDQLHVLLTQQIGGKVLHINLLMQLKLEGIGGFV